MPARSPATARVIDVSVDGAKSDEDARRAARSVASSLLVKTAVYGRDPNWGRIMMAVGKTGIELDESRIKIFINDIQIVEGGVAIPYYTPSVVAALGEPEVFLRISLSVGEGVGRAWGCDLSEEYVVFNSDAEFSRDIDTRLDGNDLTGFEFVFRFWVEYRQFVNL